MAANSPEKVLEELVTKFKSVAIRLPVMAGNIVVNFALDNFKRQGFLGATFQAWKPRKTNLWGKKKQNNRNILVLRGILRRGTRIIKADWDSVVVGNSVPYAQAHNDGSRLGLIQKVGTYTRKVTKLGVTGTTNRKKKIKVKYTQQVSAHTRRINQNIPARPFLKDSPYLRASLNRGIGTEVYKALK